MGGMADFLGMANKNEANSYGAESMGNASGKVGTAFQNQQNFLNALQTQNPAIFQQQAMLGNQLSDQAQGNGPNPALAQLANTTSQNISNQAAMMAGQRGMSQNPGLAARQIANQGAQQQQAAAGQAAALRAQQQLAAQQQLGNFTQGQLANQQGTMSGMGNLAASNLGSLSGFYNGMNSINAQTAQANANADQKILGGVLGGAGAAFGMAHGGQVPGFASGGTLGVDFHMPGQVDNGPNNLNLGLNMGLPGAPAPQAQPVVNPTLGVDTTMPTIGNAPTIEPQSRTAKFAQGFSDAYGAGQENDPLFKGMQGFSKGLVSQGKNFFKPGSGSVPIYQNGKETGEMAFSKGGTVPGKPKVFGDNEANDTVPAKLSPGEVVIPRSKVKDPQKVADFINQVLGFNLKAGKA